MKYVVISKVITRNNEKIVDVYSPILANQAWERLGIKHEDLSTSEMVRAKNKVDSVFLGESSSERIYKKMEEDGNLEKELWITK